MKSRLMFLFLGLTAFACVISWFGWREVLTAFAAVGWYLLPVVLLHALPLAIDTLAWFSVFSVPARPSALALLCIRWTGESVNNLFPVAQVGGDLLRARLASLAGSAELATAGATVAVDVTGGLISQIIFGMAGLAFLLGRGRSSPELWIGFSIFTACIAGFWIAQRRGMFGLAARLGLSWADRLDGELRTIYRSPRPLLINVAIRSIARAVACIETYAGLHLLGAPITLLDALILQSIVSLLRSAAFPIPGGLGAQEAGLVLIGGMLGIPPHLALALALIRRAREVALGVPGLLVWPLLEKR